MVLQVIEECGRVRPARLAHFTISSQARAFQELLIPLLSGKDKVSGSIVTSSISATNYDLLVKS